MIQYDRVRCAALCSQPVMIMISIVDFEMGHDGPLAPCELLGCLVELGIHTIGRQPDQSVSCTNRIASDGLHYFRNFIGISFDANDGSGWCQSINV
jgi:hypothetical protein